MRIGNREFDFEKHFYVMGILNVTPDSFSDGGNYNDVDRALFHTEQMISEGATIIDVGGESTRPGHEKITDDEEIERVAPVITAIKSRFDIPVSLDTYKVRVAAAGIDAGADLINDIWGLRWDEDGAMARLVAEKNVAYCLMHNEKSVEQDDSACAIDKVILGIKKSLEIANGAGISKDKIMIDPGIGFAKDLDGNLSVMKELSQLCKLGYPILLGTSRKSMIGLALDLPVDQRVEGTIATSVIGYQAGCRIFRVHDVKENLRALQMTEAIMKAN